MDYMREIKSSHFAIKCVLLQIFNSFARAIFR